MMTQATAILGLLAQTSIHAGTGSNIDIIDLPIQREGHTGYPCVFGSSMKGALRAHAEKDGKDKASVVYVFGPDTNAASDHAGALIISDARLLLLPVRSLTSAFKWVTCPDVLKRYQRDALRFNYSLEELQLEVSEEQAYVHTNNNTVNDLFLEEYRFSPCATDLSRIIEQLATLMHRNDATQALEKQLVIVSDTMFAHLCQHATPVNAHIALESVSKTVAGGALWYEETLPPDTLLYLGLSANRVRRPDEKKIKTPLPPDESAAWVLDAVTGLFKDKPWLQVGGNETVGMGWCAVTVLKGVKQ